ncbi:NAD(P)H-dependent oxidoreductase [Winogradskyella sp. MH6]|uniref:NAD(P)H-dependent oxidoreductase n=1 Tax=Winogradskyella sp. MH6 TaxID=2929510 RepID=UPI000C65C3FC|nr:NAD(P)H-dependent oxidoreductase [Winogradskyella sp. MH6]MAB49025.1 NAD(P)H-dependent oxidoreductase [Flavobacteriaceae bacterium]MAX72021.1 NAD(P)H-dependent oxidoreductase [Flavobacteriaceae bacterium]|tara:strand:- start:7494 stop:8123 length:630 start_codon:yes stop_codon:yes gene_type:complete
MSIIEKLKWRYATKKFDTSKSLSQEQLNTLKEAFNLTALSYGLQTLKLVVVEDKNKREQLVDHSYGQRQVADSSHLLVICIQNEINEEDVDNHFDIIKNIRQTPDEILDPFRDGLKSTIQNMTPNTKNNWATRQAYIVLGNLMTVCAVEQIDSCPMEGFVSEKVDKVLELDKYGLTSVLLFPVGYRADDDMFASLKKVRKPLSETIIEL